MSNDKLKSYISGGISGLIEVSFVHPIEYFKTTKQYSNKKINFTSFIRTTYTLITFCHLDMYLLFI